MVLLHLLRFARRDLSLSLTAAHLDHAMRDDSASDARWLTGVCAAWEVPLVRRRLEGAPRGEDAARRARYEFLREAACQAGAEYVLTAHHADDQAETVLFRILRGTGLAGLRGIPARGEWLLRPLLPFWREELEAYAASVRLRWRTDLTNHAPVATRNRIRLHLLPLIEREIAPGARRSLVALADLAREAEGALEERTTAGERVLVRFEDGAAVLARDSLRNYDSATRARILRRLLRRFDVVLDRTGTRTALQFITNAPSGRELQLPSGVRIRLEFDAARIDRPRATPPDEPLMITVPTSPAPGEGSLRVGGRRFRAAWRVAPASEPAATADKWRVALDVASLDFPLFLRGWLAGDRIRTAGGTKTLKKTFLEQRIARWERSRLPVLVDAHGSVLWVAEVGSAFRPGHPGSGDTLILTVSNV